MSEYQVKIRGEYADDDGLRIEMPKTEPHQAWYEIDLPPCPDCGGDIIWWEAGYVPGTRKCNGCGSLFSVRPLQTDDGGKVYLCREQLLS